jgi:hypothetical protein
MSFGDHSLGSRPDLEQRIVGDLAGFGDRNEIIRYVCEATGMRWNEASLYVKAVEEQHRPGLSVRRKGLLLFLGLSFAVGGLAIVGLVIAATLDGWMVMFMGLPIPYLGNAAYLGTGILITAGALAGSWRLFTQEE